MKHRPAKSSKKVPNSLVAMSSAAVLAVYSAGYVRTRPAAERLAAHAPEPPREALPAAQEIPPPPMVRSAEANTSSPNAAPASEQRQIEPQPKPEKAAEPAARAVAPAASAMPVTTAPARSDPAPATTEVAAESAVTAAVASVNPVSPATPAPETQSAVSPANATAPSAPAAPVWKDGKYSAWGTCRHGDIQATVVIEGGRIKSAEISDCQTRYSCDIIDSLPPKLIQRQKNKFDIVGGATESAYAFYGAVYWALDQASK